MRMELFFLIIVIMMTLGFPIGITLLTSSFFYFLFEELGIHLMISIMVNGSYNFLLLSIPFFILAANIMEDSKITDTLFDFSNKLVGHIRGGLSHVNIVSSIIFSGMSGSAIADTSGIGYVATKAMIKKGFDPAYSAALTVGASTIGPIIPPSIVMVLYAGVSGASIGKLFLGGIIPGFLMGFALMCYCFLISKKYNFPESKKASLIEFISSFKAAFLPLLTPVILLGGIFSGKFTPTEAAVVATFYVLIVAFLKREFHFRSLMKTSARVIVFSGNVMFIVATAALFSFIIAREQMPQQLAKWIISLGLSRTILLLTLNIVFLFLGSIFDTNTILLVFVPIVLPLLPVAGIDLIHFGVIVCLNATIGLLTPPFAINLYVISGLVKIPFEKIFKKLWPILLVLIGVLFLITFVEPFVMWLPSFFN